MKLFRRTSVKNMQLVFLLKSANYDEIINLLEKGIVAYSELEDKDIEVIFNDAIRNDKVRNLVVIFDLLDNNQKQQAIKCFGELGIFVPQNIIETNLKLFLKVSLEENYDKFILDILKIIIEQVNRFKKEFESIKEYINNAKNDRSMYIIQMRELVCKTDYERLFEKRSYFRYFSSLDIEDKKLHVKYFMDSVPNIDRFKSFVANTECLDIIIYNVLSSPINLEDKFGYLFALLELEAVQEKDKIIDILLSFNDAWVVKQLKQKYLFDMAGRIISVKLLSLYLMDALSEKEFRRFLDRVVDYRLVLKTIGSANLSLEVRNTYLKCLLDMDGTPYKDKIREELRKYEVVVEEHFVEEEITQESTPSKKAGAEDVVDDPFAEEESTHINAAPQDGAEVVSDEARATTDNEPVKLGDIFRQVIFGAGEKNDQAKAREKDTIPNATVVDDVATVEEKVRDDEKSAEAKVGVDMEEDSSSVTPKVDKVAAEAVELPKEEQVQEPKTSEVLETGSKLANPIPKAGWRFSIRDYILSCPRVEDFQNFIIKNDNLEEVYAAFENLDELMDPTLLSEYVYVIFKLNQNKKLETEIISDILYLGNKEICSRTMEEVSPIEQQKWINWAIKHKYVRTMLVLACITDCAYTYTLIESLFKIGDISIDVMLALNLQQSHLDYALSILLQNPKDYFNMLIKLDNMIEDSKKNNMENNLDNLNMALDKLRYCVKIIFDMKKEGLFDAKDVETMHQIMNSSNDELLRG